MSGCLSELRDHCNWPFPSSSPRATHASRGPGTCVASISRHTSPSSLAFKHGKVIMHGMGPNNCRESTFFFSSALFLSPVSVQPPAALSERVFGSTVHSGADFAPNKRAARGGKWEPGRYQQQAAAFQASRGTVGYSYSYQKSTQTQVTFLPLMFCFALVLPVLGLLHCVVRLKSKSSCDF